MLKYLEARVHWLYVYILIVLYIFYIVDKANGKPDSDSACH